MHDMCTDFAEKLTFKKYLYIMTAVGINGFDRISKCIFIQLINNKNFTINFINTSNLISNILKL